MIEVLGEKSGDVYLDHAMLITIGGLLLYFGIYNENDAPFVSGASIVIGALLLIGTIVCMISISVCLKIF